MGDAKANGTVYKEVVMELSVGPNGEMFVNGRRSCIYTHGWKLPEMLEIAKPLMIEAKQHFGCYMNRKPYLWWVSSMWAIHRGGEKLNLPDLKREARDAAIARAIATLARRISRRH
jgi:hypothetical protein